jgi:hypothetical protein
VVTFPFLEKDNFKDLMFVNLLLVERPFKAGYGSTIKAWDDIATQLRDAKHPESGEPLYGAKAIRGKALKERFLAIMDFVKHQDRDILRRTGTDDEPEPGEIENAIADLYSDWQSHCAQGDSKSQSQAAKKKQDRDAAEAVHQALLGNMTAIYASDDLSDPDAEDGPLQTPTNNRRLSYGLRGNGTSSSATSKRSRSPVFLGQQNDAIQELLTKSQERDEARAMFKGARVELEEKKDDREKKRDDRDDRRLQLEEERLRLESERNQHKRAKGTATIQLMQALAQSLLNKNNHNNKE